MELFDTWIVFLKEFFEKVDFEKSADDKKSIKKNSQGAQTVEPFLPVFSVYRYFQQADNCSA